MTFRRLSHNPHPHLTHTKKKKKKKKKEEKKKKKKKKRRRRRRKRRRSKRRRRRRLFLFVCLFKDINIAAVDKTILSRGVSQQRDNNELGQLH